jgi:amidase
VALWTEDPFAPVDREVSDAAREAALRLQAAGATIDETARPSLRFAEAFEVYALLNHAVVAYGLPPKIRARIQAQASGFSPNDLSHQSLQARGARMTPGLYQQLSQRRLALKRRWASFFARYDVLLCPPAPVAAIPHDHAPDIQAGLPLGIQVIAAAGEDRMAIAVGAMLERSGAGYRAPPGTRSIS